MDINYDVIEKINNIDWFSKCGIGNDLLKVSCAHTFVSEIDIVLNLIKSIKWQNYTLDRRNEITGFLFHSYNDIYNASWNKKSGKIKQEIFPDLFSKIKAQSIEKFSTIYSEIITDMQWDIHGIIMAYSYSSYYSSLFYKDMLEIYASGHIPCGVKGKEKDNKTYLTIF